MPVPPPLVGGDNNSQYNMVVLLTTIANEITSIRGILSSGQYGTGLKVNVINPNPLPVDQV
nr:MAG: hypothetical protein [Microviridae sp.]